MTKCGKGRRVIWSNRFSCVARRRGRNTKDSHSDRTTSSRRIGFEAKKVESLGARDSLRRAHELNLVIDHLSRLLYQSRDIFPRKSIRDNLGKLLESSLGRPRKGLRRIVDITFVIERRDRTEHVNAVRGDIHERVKTEGNLIRVRIRRHYKFRVARTNGDLFRSPRRGALERCCSKKFAIKHLHRFCSTRRGGKSSASLLFHQQLRRVCVNKPERAILCRMRAQAGRQPAITAGPNQSNLYARLSVNSLSFSRRTRDCEADSELR